MVSGQWLVWSVVSGESGQWSVVSLVTHGVLRLDSSRFPLLNNVDS